MIRKIAKSLITTRKRKVALGVVVFLIILLILASIIIHTNYFKSYLMREANQYLQTKYNLSLSSKEIEYSLVRFSITLYGVEVKPVTSEKSFLQHLTAEKVRINLPIAFLFSEKIHIQELKIYSPHIVINQFDNERKSEDVSKKEEDSQQGKPLFVQIDEFYLGDGILNYSNKKYAIQGFFPKVDAHAYYSNIDKKHSGEIQAQNEKFSISKSALPISNISAKFEFDSETLFIETFSIVSDASHMDVSGWLKNYQGIPQYNFQVKTSLQLEEFKLLFDPVNKYEGIMNLEAEVKGEGRSFDVSGRLNGEDVILNNLPITTLDATFRGNENALSISDFDINAANGNLHGNLTMKFPPEKEYSLSITWASLDLKELTANLPNFPIILTSKLEGSLSAQWHDLSLEDMDACGDITFDSSNVVLQKRTEQNLLDGRINFKASQGNVEVEQSYVSINEDLLKFSGNLNKEEEIIAQFTLKSDNLSRTERLLNLLKENIKASLLQNIPALGAAGSSLISGDITGSLRRPRVSLQLEGYDIKTSQFIANHIIGNARYEERSFGFTADMRQLQIEEEDIDRVEAEGSVKSNMVIIKNFKAFKSDGILEGDLKFDFHNKSYTLKTKGKNIDLQTFRYLNSRDITILGDVDLILDGQGTLENPKLSLRIASPKLQAYNAELQDVTFFADLISETVTFSLVIPEGKTEIEGSLKLNEPYMVNGVFRSTDFHIENVIRDNRLKLNFSGEFSASASFDFPLRNMDDLSAALEIKEAKIKYKEISASNSDPILINIKDREIEIKDFSFIGSNTEFNSYGKIPIKAEKDGSLKLDGKINLRLLEPFVKNSQIAGLLTLQSELKGNLKKPDLSADIRLADGSLTLAFMPYNFQAITLQAQIDKDSIKLERFSALIDNGNISAKGSLSLASLPFTLPQQLFSTAPETKAVNELLLTFTNLPLENVARLVNSDFASKFEGFTDGRIKLRGSLKHLNQMEIEGELNRILISLSQIALKNERDFLFSLKNGVLTLDEIRFVGDNSSITVAGSLDITEKRVLNSRILAEIDSALLAPFTTTIIPGGTSSWEFTLMGPITNPTISGMGEIKNGFFQLRDFPVAANNVTGKIELSNYDIKISDVQGYINGGPFNLSGDLHQHNFEIDTAALSLSAKNIQLNYPEGLIGQADTTLTLSKKGKKWLLSGDVSLLHAYYGRDVHPGSQLLRTMRSPGPRAAKKADAALQALELDLTVSTVDSLIIDNNMANLELLGNLGITGNLINPVFSGRVTNKYAGEVVFGEQRYQLEKATIDFLGTEQLDPYLNVVAHTRIRHKYDELEIKLTLTGPLSNLDYSLSSFPPRSHTELASLLITGRGLDEVKSETANIIGNQMALYFSSPVASPVTKKLEKLLKIEEVNIEPINIATEEDPGARFTFTKNISKNVALTYSVDVSDSQHQTWLLDYNLGRNFSIRSFRKGDGNYGSSVRHRFAFGAKKSTSQELIQAQRDRLPVGDVNLTGDLIFPREVVEEKIRSLKRGETFDYVKLRKAMENVRNFYMENGYLSAIINPNILYTEDRNVSLTLQIIPQMPISLLFAGNPISKKVKKKIINSWDGRLPEEMLLEEAQGTILESLRIKGFYDAEVALNRQIEAENATFIFTIMKGYQYTIRKFDTKGSISIELDTIKSAIKSIDAEGKTELWLVIYNFEQAKEAIEALYEDNGFLGAMVHAPEVTLNHEQRFVDITLVIDEGPLSLVQAFELNGNQAFSEHELKKGLQLNAKTIFRPPLLSDDRNHLFNLYKTGGYQDVEISVELIPIPDSPHMKISYIINEGMQHSIAEIEIKGNRRTPDYLIYRELTFKEGDILNLTVLSQSQKNLYDLGIFKSVTINSQPIEQESNREKVVVEIQEADNFAVTYGLRYDSEMKLEGIAEFSLYNIFGRGRNGLVYYRQNDRQKDFRLSLQEPYVFGKKLNSLYSFYYTEELITSFKIEEIGFSFQQQRTLPHKFSLSYLYKFHRIHTYELEPIGPFIFDITLFLSELSAFVVRDTRDNKMDSQQGSFISFSFTYSPEFLGSDLTYISMFAQYSLYKALRSGIVWASNYRVGLADAFDQVLIPSERFYAGGGNSIRGFELDVVGPIDPFFGDAEGGEALFIMNQELRFPLYKWIRGVAFYDMGNVYTDFTDFNPFDARHSIGFGLRLDTPISLIRLDYGINLFPRLDEPRAVLFFSLGQSF